MKFAVEHLLVESEHAPPLGCLVEHVRVDPGGEAGIGVPKVLCDLVDRAAR